MRCHRGEPVSSMTLSASTASELASFDLKKFESIHQIGGIRTGTLDSPGAGGGVRVAFFDTGAGFRFTVALDRGGDIIDAQYNHLGLAYLSPNGLKPPNPAYHVGNEWLRNWPGGLVTTCGPEYIGGSRTEGGVKTSLHGRYSNTAAVVESLKNPDLRQGRTEFELVLLVRDTSMFGPVFNIRRTLRCTLGQPEVIIEDEVTNEGDTPTPHHWLYHCNLGYPLLDAGARFVYRGAAEYWIAPPPPGQDIVQPLAREEMNQLKLVPEPMAEHVGGGERGLIVDVEPDANGLCRVGLINEARALGLEFSYSSQAMPRLAHWQHYGPQGAYVSGIEPFYGSLLGSARDRHPLAVTTLAPGESRRYQLRLRLLSTVEGRRQLLDVDGPVFPRL